MQGKIQLTQCDLSLWVSLQGDDVSNSINSIPSSGDLWNVYVNIQTGRLDLWESLVPRFIFNPSTPFFETIVPTTETVRMGYIMERLLAVNHPVLFTGQTGKAVTPSYTCLEHRELLTWLPFGLQ
jgi:hypothetical protein